ncbi:MAG: hypothetical protein ACYCZI_09360 [Metallibacterium scheffleri]
MTWKPHEHTDQDNLQWAWLRAVEWGRWPLFLSQTVAPILLIWLSWQVVVVAAFSTNVVWALFVRYRFNCVAAADFGALFALAKWVTWPAATAEMFFAGRSPECWVALAWPVLIFPLGMFTPTRIGYIQTKFMRALGYEPSDVNPLSRNV